MPFFKPFLTVTFPDLLTAIFFLAFLSYFTTRYVTRPLAFFTENALAALTDWAFFFNLENLTVTTFALTVMVLALLALDTVGAADLATGLEAESASCALSDESDLPADAPG